MYNADVYPIWWDTTLTIYNKHTDSLTGVVKWYRHVVNGAFWKYIGNKININDVIIETNDVICRVRKDEAFLEKFEWMELPNDLKANHFTFGKGDIIVKGEVDELIDEYTNGKRSTDFTKKYKDLQGCMVIEEWTVDTGIGRCSEHYRIRGS